MKVYLAARYSRREELCTYREWLQTVGFTVTSRWLNGEHQISDSGLALGSSAEHAIEGDSDDAETVALRKRFANEDWNDLKAADIVVAFTESPRTGPSRGGRHVELGAALAWGQDVLVVGYRENVFCCLDAVDFYETWDTASAALAARLVTDLREQPRLADAG